MDRWTETQATTWYEGQPWLVGCNFIPSTAINQLEMWQADTFDVPTIQRELGWAAGLWTNGAALNTFQLEASDVVTFHNYNDRANLETQIAELRRHGRPLVCTEWLRRGHSNVAECLPVFAREGVGCCNWGLVSGKTQTIFPWGSPAGAPEPALWFHDLLHPDGSAYDPHEVRLFMDLTGQTRASGRESSRVGGRALL